METRFFTATVTRGADSATQERTLVVASTATPDRYQDIVDQSTWKLDNFRANPVIPWGHDYSLPPVGRAVSVEMREGALVAEIEWDTGEHNPLGRLVADQFAAGFLNAVSVGFRPGRAIQRGQLPAEDPRFGASGMVFYDNELLEISAVTIPANAEALAAKGLPVCRLTPDEVKAEVRRLLAEDAEVLADLATVPDRFATLCRQRAMRSLFG